MAVVRAQSFNKVLVACLLCFLLALALTSYSAKNPAFASAGTAAANGVLRPFQALHRWLFHSLTAVWDGYIDLVAVEQENQQLRSRLEVLESENSRFQEVRQENERLRDLLKATEQTQLTGITAAVIAHDPSNWSQSITVNRGLEHGVTIGRAVVVGDGLVGQVISTSARSARVLLITDPSSGVDALLQDSRVRGIVSGAGRFRATWNYVLANESVQIGDRVVSSGLDGVYPKGLLIGVVSAVKRELSGRLFSSIDLQPAVNFTRLETVLILNPSDGASNSQATVDTKK